VDIEITMSVRSLMDTSTSEAPIRFRSTVMRREFCELRLRRYRNRLISRHMVLGHVDCPKNIRRCITQSATYREVGEQLRPLQHLRINLSAGLL
jgi:hypothetical protein